MAGSFAAVLAVYTAGYARTQSAANRLAAQVAERRASVPARERVVFPGPARPSTAPFPTGSCPPAAERTRNVVPSAKVETAQVPGQGEKKVDVPASVAEPAHIETPEPLPPPAQTVTAAPVVAAAPTPAVPSGSCSIPAPAPAKPAWKDGTYTGWGYSRHGNIEAAVVIEGGRILSATITQCRTRYSCDVIDRTASRRWPSAKAPKSITSPARPKARTLSTEQSSKLSARRNNPAVPVRTEAVMGTLVTIHVVRPSTEADAAIDRAFGWFHEIEARCTRFNPR